MAEITVGLTGRAERVVTDQNTAYAVGSGLLPVFATPCMIALMEEAAVSALAPCLEPGYSTVGTHLNVAHNAATPVGLHVWAEAQVTAIDGKQITFTVSAYDDVGEIGTGTHQRFIVVVDRFLDKSQQRKSKA